MTNIWDELDKESAAKRDYISLKDGDTVKLTVKDIYKDAYAKFKPKKKDGTEQAYSIVILSDEGKTLTVGSFALQRALKETLVSIGDTIEISHPARGKYFVRKLQG